MTTQIEKEIKSYISHFTRDDKLKIMRYGTVKPFQQDDRSYQVQTNQNSKSSGFWTDIKEDNFLLKMTYSSMRTPQRAIVLILQSFENSFIPGNNTDIGIDGLKNAIAFVFNTNMSNERLHGKKDSVSVYCDKGKGLQLGKFDYIFRQDCQYWPSTGDFNLEIVFINKTFHIMANNKHVVSYQLTDAQWKIIQNNNEKKYIGLSIRGNGDRSEQINVDFKNIYIKYIDSVETAKVVHFQQKMLKTPSILGKTKQKGNTLVMIDGKDQTSAFWFPIQFENELFVHFSAYMSLVPFEGFAFVLQNQGKDVIGEGGKGKGYKGIQNGVAIEYSCLSFKDLHDPYCTHVAIMCNDNHGISNDHENSIGFNESIDKDMWKENKCFFEMYLSEESIVCWMNGKMMIHQKYDQFEKIIKKKMFIGITASSSFDGYLAISDFGIKSQ